MKVLVLLYTLVITITSQNTAYVKPNDFSADMCSKVPCLTLDQYLEHIDSYFTKGSYFIFLAGNHSITGTMNLTSLSNITLKAEDTDLDTNIMCTGRVAIHCSNFSDLTIEGVTFVLADNQVNDVPALNIVGSTVLITNTRFLGRPEGSPITLHAVRSTWSNVTFINCTFEDITGYDVGAVHALVGSNLTFKGGNFSSNRAMFGDGGAIHADRTCLHLEGSHFQNNFGRQKSEGGAIHCQRCLTLTMTGKNTFKNNFSNEGGAIYAVITNLNVSGIVHFIENTATEAGGAIYVTLSVVEFHGSIIFDGNFAAKKGGGMSMELSSIITHTDNLTFSNNTARTGGALFMSEVPDRLTLGGINLAVLSGKFINNSANDGGGLYITTASNITFKRITVLENTGKFVGGIFSSDSILSFEGDTWFGYNTGLTGGAMKCQGGIVSLSGNTTFSHNTAHSGGAVYSIETKLLFKGGGINFTLNRAQSGGAMYFKSGTILALETETNLTLWRNHASEYGGGIYHEDSPTVVQCYYPESEFKELPYCFLQLEQFEYVPFRVVSIHSYDNTAGVDGTFLYGGLLHKCRLMTVRLYQLTSYDYFVTEQIIHIDTPTATTKGKDVTSDAYELCLCHGNATKCNNKSQNIGGKRLSFLC